MHISGIQTLDGTKQFNFENGKTTLIVGPNGVGKSALLYQLYRNVGQSNSVYLPGHRSITFNHGYENLQMSLVDLERNLYSQTDSFNRYKSQWAEEQFKSVVRRLHHSHTAYNESIISRIRNGENADDLVRLKTSPLDIINHCFSVARMAVSFKMTDSGIQAYREGITYSIDQLSDGERAALFIVGIIVVTEENRVLVIDEPERHLHPSISAPLISTAVRSRPSLSYIFASHDLSLIENLQADQILFVKNSIVLSQRPENRAFDVVELDSLSEISDELKRDILGIRDRVLFVEGESTSLDRPLYAAVYPEWKISPRGGADKVIEATGALKENSNLHWIHAVGLVDGDGRENQERASLRLKQIEVIDFPSIENLFFLKPVVQKFCQVISDLEGGDPISKLDIIEASLKDFVIEAKEEIIHRRTAWRVNRRLAESKVSVSDIRSNTTEARIVDIEAIRLEISSEIDRFLAGNCGLDELQTLPIKATPIPARISQLAGAASLKKYKEIILRQIESNTPAGEEMLREVAGRLPVLG